MRGQAGTLRNLGILTAAQVAAQLLNVVALVYLARRVGAHWFGVLQVGVAVMAYALISAEWGLFSTGVRAVARLDRPEEVRLFARRQTGLMALLAALVLAAGLLVLPRLSFFREDPWIFRLYLLAVVPQVFMLDWVGVGLERMIWPATAKVVRSLVYAGAVLLLLARLDGVLGWPDRHWVPLLLLLSLVVGNVVMAVPLARWLGGPVWPAFGGLADWRGRLALAAPLGGSIVVMRVLLNADIVALGLLAKPDVAGGYAAAAKIVFVLVTAVEVLWNALLPRLSRLWRESPARFRARLALYLGLVLALFAPAAAGGAALGGPFMHLLYGAQFPVAGIVFRLLSISYVVLAVGQFFGNALVACDRQRAAFPPVAMGAGVAIALAALLIPRAGAVGAAVAMLCAHLTLLAGSAWACRRLIGRRLGEAAGITIAAATAMGLAVARVGTAWPLAAAIAAGIALYAALAGWPLWRWYRRARAEAA
ncbi:MAG: oligosaccharide flippase family protein [Candidatus Krumholzibacteriia bacterium]